MEILGKTYELTLAFSLSDALSLIAVCMTVWIACQTHQLQKRQLANDLFPKRQEIYRAALKLLADLSMIGAMPKRGAYDELADGRMVKYYYDEETNQIVQSLRQIYDQRLALGPGGFMQGDAEKSDKLLALSKQVEQVGDRLIDKLNEII